MELQLILDRLDSVLRQMAAAPSDHVRDGTVSFRDLTNELAAIARARPDDAPDCVDLIVHCGESILGMRDRDGITREQFMAVALDTLSHLRQLLVLAA